MPLDGMRMRGGFSKDFVFEEYYSGPLRERFREALKNG